MTDRIRHVTVTLDKDYRDDDVDGILDAIRRIRGVGSVTPRVVDLTDHLAREVVRVEMKGKLHEAISSVFHSDDIRKMGREP